MRRPGCLLLALLLSAPAAAGEGASLPDYAASYSVSWGSMGLGEARFELQHSGDDCYRYESVTEPAGLVKMFYGTPRETSEFCVVDGALRSRLMEFSNPKKNDAFQLRFDWDAGTVSGPGEQQRELPADAVDRHSLQQAVRLWLLSGAADKDDAERTWSMVEDDRIKPYTFRRVGPETVRLGKREFDALRVDRVDDPKKSVRFWLDPAAAYRILRFEQQKADKPVVRMEWIPTAD